MAKIINIGDAMYRITLPRDKAEELLDFIKKEAEKRNIPQSEYVSRVLWKDRLKYMQMWKEAEELLHNYYELKYKYGKDATKEQKDEIDEAYRRYLTRKYWLEKTMDYQLDSVEVDLDLPFKSCQYAGWEYDLPLEEIEDEDDI